MENLKILLCCGAGMSSGFLASNARKVAKKQKLSVSVEARSHSEVAEHLNYRCTSDRPTLCNGVG